MTPAQKREKTLKKDLLELIRNSPEGIAANSIALHLRHLLRVLESKGDILYAEGKWHYLEPVGKVIGKK